MTALNSVNDLLDSIKDNTENLFEYFEGENLVSKPFSDVYRDIINTEQKLLNHGITSESIVGLCAENSIYWFQVHSALIRIGCTIFLIPEPIVITPSEVLIKYDLSLFITDLEHILNSASPALDIRSLTGSGSNVVDKAGSPYQTYSNIIFSSGSTGKLKLIKVSDMGSIEFIRRLSGVLTVDKKDNLLVFLPLSNYQQSMLIYFSLFTGMNLTICKPAEVFLALAKSSPTHLLAPPVFYEGIHQKFQSMPFPSTPELASAYNEKIKGVIGQNMRFMITGMAPIKRSTLEFFHALELPLYEAYGTIETGPIAINTPDHNKIGSVGKLITKKSVNLNQAGEINITLNHLLTKGYIGEEDSSYVGDNSFNTGDIGVIDDDGYLFLKGRKKFLIITPDGKKTHPELIEAKLNDYAEVRHSVVYGNELPEMTVIISSVAGVDRPVILDVVDCVNDQLEPSLKIQNVIVTEEEFTVFNGLLTRNMKIDRNKIFERFYESRVSDSKHTDVKPSSESEMYISSLWKDVIGTKDLSVNDDFFQVGGHSLFAIEVVQRLKENGYQISISDFYKHSTIGKLADFIQHNEQTYWDQDEVETHSFSGPVPLLGSQRWYMQNVDNHGQWVSAVTVDIREGISEEKILTAVNSLVAYHESLRSVFKLNGSEWACEIMPKNDFEYFSTCEEPYGSDLWAGKIQSVANSMADLKSPLFYCMLSFSEEVPKLTMLCHHLIGDQSSLSLVVDTLFHLLSMPDIKLQVRKTTFLEFSKAEQAFHASDVINKEVESYWEKLPWLELEPIATLDDEADGSSKVDEFNLDIDKTHLSSLSETVQTDEFNALSSVVIESCRRTFGLNAILVSSMHSGRTDRFPNQDELDLTEIVGWLAQSQKYFISGKGELALSEIVSQIQSTPMSGRNLDIFLSRSESYQSPLRQAIEHHIDINFQTNSLSKHNVKLELLDGDHGRQVNHDNLVFNVFPSESGCRLNITYSTSVLAGSDISVLVKHIESFYRS